MKPREVLRTKGIVISGITQKGKKGALWSPLFKADRGRMDDPQKGNGTLEPKADYAEGSALVRKVCGGKDSYSSQCA